MVYVEKAIEIYARGSNGALYTLNSDIPSGVTVTMLLIRDANFEFHVAMQDLSNSYAVEYSTKNELISGVSVVSSLDNALEEENRDTGVSNTRALISKSATIGTFFEGFQGEIESTYGEYLYLGCLGEWMTVINNLDIINQCLEKYGGEKISRKNYWTSTQKSDIEAWAINIWDYFLEYYTMSKSMTCSIRPFITNTP